MTDTFKNKYNLMLKNTIPKNPKKPIVQIFIPKWNKNFNVVFLDFLKLCYFEQCL